MRGLEEAGDLGAQEIKVFMDSELIVKQLKGEYRVKDDGMKELFRRTLEVLKDFKSFEIKHIDRSKNKEADKLANRAINLSGV
ncbi:MAG: ribonuclease HI family protein [Candidatus Omnitrophica bacterium]|nr:ribonuclease HI family protein [Candidatus Omnitrophota bacterium]